LTNPTGFEWNAAASVGAASSARDRSPCGRSHTRHTHGHGTSSEVRGRASPVQAVPSAARPARKYSSYHIEELLKDEANSTATRSDEAVAQVIGNPAPLSAAPASGTSQSLYYSYYCQALLAHYNNNGNQMQNRHQSSHH
jgi:hypothetical protein